MSSRLYYITSTTPQELKQKQVMTTAFVLRFAYYYLCFALFSSTFAIAEETNEENDNNNIIDNPIILECDLYMADSTIPNAGQGIFTGVPKKSGDLIGNGDVCFPMVDLYFHNDWDNFFNPFVDYVWDGTIMGMHNEVVGDDIHAVWPGLDCAINCNLALLNVDKATPEYDEAKLHRSKHPTAGAITPYHDGSTFVIRDIPSGGELFKFYGDDWFTTRDYAFKGLPLKHDYDYALDILNTFHDGHKDTPYYESLFFLVNHIRNIYYPSDGRILNALPRTLPELKTALEEQDLGMLHQPNATRSIEWLQTHGKCIDHIVHGPSSIEGAGRGAFAKRDLPKNTIITGTPLHHVPFKRTLEMYDITPDPNAKHGHRRTDTLLGYQVMYNYCFGHRSSTMLICPYGAGVNYINHNQTQANVRIQWAAHGSVGHNNTMLEMTPREIEWNFKTGLGFDYVATKDIKKGDELFLDYGIEWENAWQLHLQNWQPKESWTDYISATEFNKLQSNYIIRTDEEQKSDPYPENIDLRCHSHLRIRSQRTDMDYPWPIDEKGYICSILSRDPITQDEDNADSKRNNDNVIIGYWYSVVLYHKENEADEDSSYGYEVHEFVPREAIQFVDVPYSTDIHLVNAFRQPIGIPDEMMPEAWKNLWI